MIFCSNREKKGGVTKIYGIGLLIPKEQDGKQALPKMSSLVQISGEI